MSLKILSPLILCFLLTTGFASDGLNDIKDSKTPQVLKHPQTKQESELQEPFPLLSLPPELQREVLLAYVNGVCSNSHGIEKARLVVKISKVCKVFNKLIENIEFEFYGEKGNLDKIKQRQQHAYKAFDESYLVKIELNKAQRIELNSTHISCFPTQLFSCTNLTYLGIENSELVIMPDIGQFLNLTTLYIGDSPLKELPETIRNLTKLEKLWITVTRISKLPQSLLQCENLVHLQVEYNPNLKHIEERLVKKLSLLWVTFEYLCEETKNFLSEWNDQSEDLELSDMTKDSGEVIIAKNPPPYN